MLALDLLMTTAGTPDPTADYTYAQRFFLSTGAGGIAVFAAALVAGIVALWNAHTTSKDAQSKADDERAKASVEHGIARERAERDREHDRQQRFWDTLTWIYERATAERLDARLTPHVTLALLDALGMEAETELEVTAVERLLGLTVDRTRGRA